jgi:hypothetical protein
MRLSNIVCTPTAASANGIFTDQQITATGSQTLDGASISGGVLTLTAAQIILFTSGAGDDVSGVNFTITGTDADGRAQTDTVVGPNAGTSSSTKYFKTVTDISADATTAGGVTVSIGWTIASVSPTARPSHRKVPVSIAVGTLLTAGTATWNLQYSLDDYESAVHQGKALNTYPTNWFTDATISAKSASTATSIGFPVTALRLQLTAASSGSVTAEIVQAGA